MEKIKKMLTYVAVFNKRFLKKPGFIAMLLLVPCLVLALNIASAGESGMVTFALARQDNADELSAHITNDIADSSAIIRFFLCETHEEACNLVEAGEADAAWIFPAQLEEKIEDFVKNRNKRYSFVKIVEREDTVLLQLARERLYSALYPYCSQALYKNYIEKNVIELETLSEEELNNYYEAIKADGDDLFRFSYADQSEDASDAENMNYITAPVRGLLAVFVTVAGFAVALFYMQDSREGRFTWIVKGNRFGAMMGYYLCAIFDVAVVVFISLFATGMFSSFGRELTIMLLYVLLCAEFCMLLAQVCGGIRLLGALVPVLAIAMIVICPVFFDLEMPRLLKFIFPPSYYLGAVHNVKYIWYMLGFTAALFAANYGIYRIKIRTNMI